jgi:ribosomal protein S18 acetylase RimI-like enzyme
VQSIGVPGHLALLTNAGYEPLRYWYEMRRDLRSGVVGDGSLPAGLERRPYDREMDDALHAAHDEAFADHWGFTPRDRDVWQTWMVGRALRTDLTSVVFDGDDIAGYALVQQWPEDAVLRGFEEVWVSHIGTRRAWRGRGLAFTLLTGVLVGAAAQGLDCVSLNVDSANPTGALGLYERSGFEVARETVSYGKPTDSAPQSVITKR